MCTLISNSKDLNYCSNCDTHTQGHSNKVPELKGYIDLNVSVLATGSPLQHTHINGACSIWQALTGSPIPSSLGPTKQLTFCPNSGILMAHLNILSHGVHFSATAVLT